MYLFFLFQFPQVIDAPNSQEIQRQFRELLRVQTRDFHKQRLRATGVTGLYINDKNVEGRAAEFIAQQLQVGILTLKKFLFKNN